MARIDGKSILITGASSGIGYEMALQLAGRKCRLALMARRKEKLEDLQKLVQEKGGEAHIFTCDVGDREAVNTAFAEADEKLGGLDIVVLNAGIGAPTPARRDFAVDRVQSIFQTNVFGVIYGLEAILPRFYDRGRGTIVGVSSLAGYRGLPGSTAYGASKAAVTNLLEGMRVELAPHNIEVIVVSPGFIDTPMTQKNRFAMPFIWPVEKAARKIIRGIERGSREIAFPFPLFATLTFAKWLPNFIWDRLATLMAPRSPGKKGAESGGYTEMKKDAESPKEHEIPNS